MARNEPTFISLDAIPEAEQCYSALPEETRKSAREIATTFLLYLARGKSTLEILGDHLQELKGVGITRQEAAALAVAAFEHASALGLTAKQRGTWFYNLALLACDPDAVKDAAQLSYELRTCGIANEPNLLANVVAAHFHELYLPS